MDRNSFFNEVRLAKPFYLNDNSWFFKNLGNEIDRYILHAYALYTNLWKMNLDVIILGDSKIRDAYHLLRNFGTISNFTNAEELGKEMERIEKVSGIKMDNYKYMFLPGSILSASMWSPILNDALIIGGTEQRNKFYMALADETEINSYSLITEQSTGIGMDKFRKIQSKFGEGLSIPKKFSLPREKRIWLRFLKRNTSELWDINKNCPRVFSREILGLMIFGYRPVFTPYDLSFVPGSFIKPGFLEYVFGLNNMGFQYNNRPLIMKKLSKYLFDNENLLN